MISMGLARHGAKKRPLLFHRRCRPRAPRDGKYLEKIGSYNPMLPRAEGRVKFAEERVKYWLGAVVDRTASLVSWLDAKLGPVISNARHRKVVAACEGSRTHEDRS